MRLYYSTFINNTLNDDALDAKMLPTQTFVAGH